MYQDCRLYRGEKKFAFVTQFYAIFYEACFLTFTIQLVLVSHASPCQLVVSYKTVSYKLGFRVHCDNKI